MPTPPRTIRARTSTRNCLRFIPCAPGPSAAARGGDGAPPLGIREHEAGDRDQQRHQSDVNDLGPELEAVGFEPQVLAHVLQLGASLDRLLPEIVDLRLLLGSENRARRRSRFAFLELLELLLRLIEAVLELLDLAQVLLLRLRLHRADDR